MGWSSTSALASAIEHAARSISGLRDENLRMILWAAARCEHLTPAWAFLKHARMHACECSAITSPCCFESLLTECEQRGLLDHCIFMLRELEHAARSCCVELGFRAATANAVAVRLAQSCELEPRSYQSAFPHG
eukprot:gnl/TRDRNA2_/TRDRNA2_117568_c0_seq1.p1 gnl/TRDRNA2_/TRDRNA2_117568_c0~~gnl/TRDRNA2_/TRDRNA2_117568_c0_seq1.p1  ORF type:complete len:134 (+),score=12.67 gnl/TRDRNA2_/TRDRNA2_117568_c0_seq1:409-810(+)